MCETIDVNSVINSSFFFYKKLYLFCNL